MINQIATTYQFITNLSFLLYEYEYASILAFFHLLVIFNQKCATLVGFLNTIIFVYFLQHLQQSSKMKSFKFVLKKLFKILILLLGEPEISVSNIFCNFQIENDPMCKIFLLKENPITYLPGQHFSKFQIPFGKNKVKMVDPLNQLQDSLFSDLLKFVFYRVIQNSNVLKI